MLFAPHFTTEGTRAMEVAPVMKSNLSVGQLLGLSTGQYLMDISFLGCALPHLSNGAVTVLDRITVHRIHRVCHWPAML